MKKEYCTKNITIKILEEAKYFTIQDFLDNSYDRFFCRNIMIEKEFLLIQFNSVQFIFYIEKVIHKLYMCLPDGAHILCTLHYIYSKILIDSYLLLDSYSTPMVATFSVCRMISIIPAIVLTAIRGNNCLFR